MRMLIEARIVAGTRRNAAISLAEIERPDGGVKQLELSLSEGRDLIRDVQARFSQCADANSGESVQALLAFILMAVLRNPTTFLATGYE